MASVGQSKAAATARSPRLWRTTVPPAASSEIGQEPCLQARLQLIDGDGQHDDDAFDDDLPELRDAEHNQAVGKHADDTGPDERTGNGAASAHKRGPSQHHSSDGIQLEGLAGGGMRCLELRGDDEADNAGAEAEKR